MTQYNPEGYTGGYPRGKTQKMGKKVLIFGDGKKATGLEEVGRERGEKVRE